VPSFLFYKGERNPIRIEVYFTIRSKKLKTFIMLFPRGRDMII